MKNLSLIISSFILLIFLVTRGQDVSMFGICQQHTWPQRFYYMFFHAGIIHCIINIYAFLSMSFLSGVKYWQLAASYLIAASMPFMLLCDTPVVGFSACLYAMSGIVIMTQRKWWSLIIVNLLLIAPQSFLPGIALLAHLYCFAVGLLFGFIFSPRPND